MFSICIETAIVYTRVRIGCCEDRIEVTCLGARDWGTCDLSICVHGYM